MYVVSPLVVLCERRLRDTSPLIWPGLSKLSIMLSPSSSNNEGNDAWLMKIDLKREEPMEINKDEGIKKATEDQTPATEDILQLDHNLLTPTEIEAFKMIELARIQNKYLTRENILLKEHIIALKGIIRKLEDLLRSMCDYPSSTTPPSSPTKKT